MRAIFGPMKKMTAEQAQAFLAFGTRTGKLAIVRKSGAPSVTPIWFVVDGDDLVFMTHESSAKAKALHRDNRAALVVDEEAPPYSFVLVEGTVALSEDRDELLHWATVIGSRYMGPERAEEYGKRNGVPGEYVVRLTPTRIVAVSGVAD